MAGEHTDPKSKIEFWWSKARYSLQKIVDININSSNVVNARNLLQKMFMLY